MFASCTVPQISTLPPNIFKILPYLTLPRLTELLAVEFMLKIATVERSKKDRGEIFVLEPI